MTNLKEAQELETFDKGVGSERVSLTADDRLTLGNETESLLLVKEPSINPEQTYLIIFKEGIPSQDFNSSSFFDGKEKLVFLTKKIPTGQDILKFAELVLEEIQKQGLKRITLIGIENGASLVQALSILDPRLFRRAILVDPTSRVSPSFITKCIDWIENFLPVGLPFRAITKDFDSRPFLHRIRCPIMVVQSATQSIYHQIESNYIASKIPNCYQVKAVDNVYNEQTNCFSSEFQKYLAQFQESPVKRPQKNL